MTKADQRAAILGYRLNPVSLLTSMAKLEEFLSWRRQGLKGIENTVEAIKRKIGQVYCPEMFLVWARHELGRYRQDTDKAFGLRPYSVMDPTERAIPKFFNEITREWRNSSSGNAVRFNRANLELLSYLPMPASPQDAEIWQWLAGYFLGAHGAAVYGIWSGALAPEANLLMVYEALLRGSEEAYQVIRHLYLLFAQCGIKLAEKDRLDQFSQGPLIAKEYVWAGHPAVEVFRKRLQSEYEEQVDRRDAKELSSLVSRKWHFVNEKIVSLWEEIAHCFRRQVKSGQDAFYVPGSLGERSGYFRYFISEGYTFPEVGVVVALPWFGKVCYVIRDLSLRLGEDLETSFELCSRLADITAYHHLVCQEPKTTKAKVPRQETNPDEAERQGIEVPEISKIVSVRGFLRSLPSGWKASEENKARFRELWGRELPEGKVWVSEFERRQRPAFQRVTWTQGFPRPIFAVNILKIIRNLEET